MSFEEKSPGAEQRDGQSRYHVDEFEGNTQAEEKRDSRQLRGAVLGRDVGQTEPRRFQEQRYRQKVDHVGVDLEEEVFGREDQQNGAGAQPVVRQRRAEELIGNSRRPQKAEKIDQSSQSITKNEPRDSHRHVRRRVVRRGRREKISRPVKETVETAEPVEEPIVQDIERDVGKGNAQDEGKRERADHET